MDSAIRPKTQEELEREHEAAERQADRDAADAADWVDSEANRIAGDLENNEDKAAKALSAGDARALFLQQKYWRWAMPEGTQP
jgi:hypothetical protein